MSKYKQDKTGSRLDSRRLQLLLAIAATLAAVMGVRRLNDTVAERRLETASLEELRALSRQRPDEARVFHYLGVRAAGAGDAPAALSAFWRAVQLAPNSEEDWLGWAAAARNWKGPQAADQVLEAFLKQNPRSSNALLERAKIYRTLEYHRAAYRYASEAARVDPSLVIAWGIMAEQAREFRDYATAETAATRVLALAPHDWRGHLELGRAFLAEHRTNAAIHAFRDAADLAPERGVTHLYLGLGLLTVAADHTRFEVARQSLGQALTYQDTLGPQERFLLLLSLGQSYRRESNWKAALEPLRAAAKIEPGDETIHYTLAQVYRGLGESDLAVEETSIHQDIARYHTAIRFLELQVGGAPDNPTPRLKLARLYASKGNVVDAAKTYQGMISRGLARDVAERELRILQPSQPPTPR